MKSNKSHTIDPGHKYKLDSIDGELDQVLTFVKREGAGYPGNVGSYPGTLLQCVIRVMIARLKYLDNQIHHESNEENIRELREMLLRLEERAAERHELDFELFVVVGMHSGEWGVGYEAIEKIPYCQKCGHIVCKHGFKHEFWKLGFPEELYREDQEDA